MRHVLLEMTATLPFMSAYVALPHCGNPDHTALSNHRARTSLKQLASGVAPESITKREQSAGVVPVESLRSSVLQGMTQLQGALESYTSKLVEIADPDISAAQIQAIIDQANVHIADAQHGTLAEYLNGFKREFTLYSNIQPNSFA